MARTEVRVGTKTTPIAWGAAALPEEVSGHPEASTWLPVLIATVEPGNRWCVRCPHCWRPNSHSAEPGFRASHCHCDGIRARDIDGYIIAPPGAEYAPYPDHCSECLRSGRPMQAVIYTPVGLEATEDARGLLADYVCDRHHRWSTRWRDPPRGREPDPTVLRRVAPGARKCALYRHFDDVGVLLYIGISERPVHRGRTHAEMAVWVSYASRMEAEWLPDRAAAEAAEKLAIQTERPVFNRTHAPGDLRQRISRYLEARADRIQRGG